MANRASKAGKAGDRLSRAVSAWARLSRQDSDDAGAFGYYAPFDFRPSEERIARDFGFAGREALLAEARERTGGRWVYENLGY